MEDRTFSEPGREKMKMEGPRRHFYHNYFNNLFIDPADLGRKEQAARKNRPTERDEPPIISPNPSQFCVQAAVRKSILSKWATFFFSPIDLSKNYEDVSDKDDSCSCSKIAINIGLNPLLTLLQESRFTHPIVCSKALLSFLDTLNQHDPEELSNLPSKILDSIIDILLPSSCTLGSDFNSPNDGSNMTAVSCASLVALVIAKGNMGQILKTVYTLLTSPSILEKQKILLPKVCTKLQKSAQALVLGTTIFPEWISHGIPKQSICDNFFIKFPCDFVSYSMCSDGSYLYIYTSKGLFKIGSGYMNTVKGYVYKSNTSVPREGTAWIGTAQGCIFLKYASKTSTLTRVSKKSLEIIDEIQFDESLSTNGVLFSDGRNLGIILPGNDGMSLKVLEINPLSTKSNYITNCTVLQIAEKQSYITEGESFNDDKFYKNLKPAIFNYGTIKSEDIAEIAKGHTFSVIRLYNGRVFFSGLGAVLGYDVLSKEENQWTEMGFGMATIANAIRKIVVGHDGQHIIFITENGEGLFSGTSQWGEDGELPKIGRQPKVSTWKLFTKLKGETIVHAACNYGSSALVTAKGQLYIYGKDANYCDSNGRLNLPNEHVVQVALGKAHIAVLTKTGSVYTLGLNNKGQCGRYSIPNESSDEVASRKNSRRTHSRKFNTSKRSSKSPNVQHGEPIAKTSDDPYQLSPGQINLRENVVQIVCGLYHTVFLTINGEVYACGSNVFGQLGVGNTSTQRGIIKIHVPPSKQIAAGNHHTVILTKTGEVYTLGSNSLGQLVRKVGNGETTEAWSSEPGPIVYLGPTHGYKAIWIGASGDATFINVEKALINLPTLQASSITSNSRNIVILPRSVEENFTCIVIHKEIGVCKSFSNGDQVIFSDTLACLDPHHDVMWQFLPDRHVIKCYNKMTIGARNLKECSIYDSLFLKDLSEISINSIANADKRALSILNYELAIPDVENCFITRSQIAAHMLACFDTYYIFHSQNLPLHVDAPPPVVDKETGYQMINRFYRYREEWDCGADAGVDAIRFSSDCDLTLGGVMLFGGTGECIARIKIYDLGYSKYEGDTEGKHLLETDDIIYECEPGQKYPIRFENPIQTKALRWYLLWAEITGRVTEFGEAGVPEINFCGNRIVFANSKLSNRRTNISFGQFPTLLVKALPNPKSKTINPIHIMSDNFGANINRLGLDSLLEILLWSWDKIKSEIWEVSSHNPSDILYKMKYFERLEYITRATMRLIKSCLNLIYPKKSTRKTEESKDFVNVIYKVRQLLIAILSYNFSEVNNKKSQTLAGPKFKHIINNVLKECCQTFQDLFHIFYPTPYLKWEILCTLLPNIEDGECTKYALFLSTVLASLRSCVTLNLVLPVFFSSDSSRTSSKHLLLVEKMSQPSIADIEIDAKKWHLNRTMDNLLELVMLPIKKHLQNERISKTENHDILVKNACDLLMRIVAELAFNAVEENEESPGVRGYMMNTPNRFLETGHLLDWNGTSDYPDVVCFEVDRPGISIVGINIYCSPGSHRYQLEMHEDCSNIYSPGPYWKCIDFIKGVTETRLFMSDTCELKFAKPIIIKENQTYAIRLWYIGAPTRHGEKGVLSVKGPDGTVFKYEKRSFGNLYTSTSRGQIPSILYLRDSNISMLSSSECPVKFPPKYFLKVAQLIITKCGEYLRNIRSEFSAEQIINCRALDTAPCLNNLLPFTLAHLAHLNDPESCVTILKMVEKLLPHVAALNLLDNEGPYDLKKHAVPTNRYIWVESTHPYKQSAVTNFRVTFPNSVAWMALEMDPRSGTAQPEDSLRIYVSRTYDSNASYFYYENESLDSNEFEEEREQAECDANFKVMVSETNVPIEVSNKLTLVPVTPKMSHNKEDWPRKTIIVPGNEVFFSMETATDYARNENANRFGFKCLVVGYEDLSDTSNISDDERRQSAFSKLEMELTYIGGMCAASLMNPTSLAHIDVDLASNIAEDSIGSNLMSDNNIDSVADENSILSKGFSLNNLPDIQQALTGSFAFKAKSIEHTFLHDFIACNPNTAGGRLARWLQPDPRVELSYCQVVLPEGEYYCGQEIQVLIYTRDQNGQMLSNVDLNVQVIIQLLDSDSEYNDELKKTEGAQPPRIELKVTKDKLSGSNADLPNSISDTEDDNQASALSSSKEVLALNNFAVGKLCGTWCPEKSGTYCIHCIIEGQMKKPLVVKVKKSLEGYVSQHKEVSMWSRQIRNFYTEDSAGLRVRALPSLQGEQLGHVPVGGSLTYEDVVINGDGLWLQLTEESVIIYCDEPATGAEAWCLQYNEHVGKSFLFPNDKILSYWEKVIQDSTDTSKLEYLVMFPTYVWTGHGPTSSVYFTLEAGKVVSIEKMHNSEGVTYGKLDRATIKKLGFFDGLNKEYWIMCSPINTHCVSHNPNANNTIGNQQPEVPPDSVKCKRNQESNQKKDAALKNQTHLHQLPQHMQRQAQQPAPQAAHHALNQPIRIQHLSFTPMQYELHGMQSDDDDTPKQTMQDPQIGGSDQNMGVDHRFRFLDRPNFMPTAIPFKGSEEMIRKQLENKADELMAAEAQSKIKDEASEPKGDAMQDQARGGFGVNLIRSKSFRAAFAALMLHEGIVHDAMAMASLLKFHPNLPKQGAQVITRGLPHHSPPNISQRHSVEISNAGQYLHIQESSLETLTRSALNASANRMRSKRSLAHNDVSIIKEEDGASSRDSHKKTENDVVCVLPAALRALRALWDTMSEILPQTKNPYQEEKVYYDSSTKKVLGYAGAKSRDKGKIKGPKIVFCNICKDLISFVDYWEHLENDHNGCGGKKDLITYIRTGMQVKTESSICGAFSHRGETIFSLCKSCHVKYAPKRKARPQSDNVDQSESEPDQDENDDIENMFVHNHSSIKRNALFSLLMVSAASNDDANNSDIYTNQFDASSLTQKALWSPVPSFQCLKNLPKSQEDEDDVSLLEFNRPYPVDNCLPLNLAEINDNGNNPTKNVDEIAAVPSTSGLGARFHRSVSMGQDASQVFTRTGSKKLSNFEDGIGGSSYLLSNPSAALRALVGVDSKHASSHSLPLSSVPAFKVNKEAILARPIMKFLLKPQNIVAIQHKMINSVRAAVMRKHGLEALNWMLHTVTQPTCLHDLMWWFVDAMTQNNTITTNKRKNAYTNSEKLKKTVPWKDSLDEFGNNVNIKVRDALHAFLHSICELMPLLPPASSLLLAAVRTCALNFSVEDHLFLHRSGIIKTLSKILSHSDEENSEDFSSINDISLQDCYREKPSLKSCNDITLECDIRVSSQPEKKEHLIDGSTETFWESAETDRSEKSWIQITFPPRMFHELSFVCLHIDNARDLHNKTELVDIRIGSDLENLQHYKYFHLLTTSSEWLLCSLPVMRDVSVVVCELRGFDICVRVRQLIVLDEPFKSQHVSQSSHTILHNLIEVETLRIFKFIASQVFEKVSASEFDSNDGALSRESNDLKEHMVGVLFSRNKFTTLQKQIMTHIISAIETETKRAKESWKKTNYSELDDFNHFDATVDEYSPNPDEYCFQMLSMVLALSGSHSGCAYLVEHRYVITDLLTLLHVGSGRVQRQVIAILRRMIKDISPHEVNAALLNKKPSIGVTFIDHLVSCISKSLSIKVKGVSSQTLQYLDDGYYSDLKFKVSNGMVTICDCLRNDLPAGLWFLRGQISQKHSKLVMELLTDMIQGKMSPLWSEATKTYVVDAIFKLTHFSESEKMPINCLSNPTIWFALGVLGILQQEQVEKLSTLGFDNSAGNNFDKKNIVKPLCMNHDDGFTHAIIECLVCGPNCQDCDRILHLHRRNKTHQRQVCKAVKNIVRVDVHEGCGRVKLFWLLALVDRQTLKTLVEFRNELDNVNPAESTTSNKTSATTGTCRYCGKHNNTGLLAIGNVCADQECQELSKIACSRVLRCGHQCGGIIYEEPCLPCLRGCASSPQASTTPMDQAAALLTPTYPAPLRQDAEDMCMICFSDPLASAPAVQFKCGHVFHYNCARKILINRWCGPRITFNFSRCPICKDDIKNASLNELLQPIRQLEEEVKRKALARLEYDGQKEAAVISSRYKGDPVVYAMERYAYYICYKCKKPYFGGEARCDADAGANTDFNQEELVCGGCSNIACGQVCIKHGDDFLEYKCRFCCSIAVFFCLGDSHFCSGCHDEFQRIRNVPVENLPHCPAGPKGVQLDGTEDDCPLGVKHVPTGQECALGCGICRNKTKTF